MVKFVGAIGARGTGAEEMVYTWAVRIEIRCEMIPEKVYYFDLDGGVGFGDLEMSIGGRAFQRCAILL